jgi:hypothetical protein
MGSYRVSFLTLLTILALLVFVAASFGLGGLVIVVGMLAALVFLAP